MSLLPSIGTMPPFRPWRWFQVWWACRTHCICLWPTSPVFFQGKFVVLNCTYSGTWAKFKDCSNTCLAQSSMRSNWTGNMWGIGLPRTLISAGEFNLPPDCGGDGGWHKYQRDWKGLTTRAEWAVVFVQGQRQMSYFEVHDKLPCPGAVHFRLGSLNTFPYCLGNKVPPAEEDPVFF